MVGRPPVLAKSRLVRINQLFRVLSQNELAVLSLQKESSSSTALSVSFINNPYQASRAPMAPPEVPLKATISWLCPAASFSLRRFFNAPAVKAVWLPPPWHAIATRLPLLFSAIKVPHLLLSYLPLRIELDQFGISGSQGFEVFLFSQVVV